MVLQGWNRAALAPITPASAVVAVAILAASEVGLAPPAVTVGALGAPEPRCFTALSAQTSPASVFSVPQSLGASPPSVLRRPLLQCSRCPRASVLHRPQCSDAPCFSALGAPEPRCFTALSAQTTPASVLSVSQSLGASPPSVLSRPLLQCSRCPRGSVLHRTQCSDAPCLSAFGAPEPRCFTALSAQTPPASVLSVPRFDADYFSVMRAKAYL
ncbi:UNVERIFIED_CONTAM: hypothetical protein FKN15_024592 [Acipenser sinensis]